MDDRLQHEGCSLCERCRRACATSAAAKPQCQQRSIPMCICHSTNLHYEAAHVASHLPLIRCGGRHVHVQACLCCSWVLPGHLHVRLLSLDAHIQLAHDLDRWLAVMQPSIKHRNCAACAACNILMLSLVLASSRAASRGGPGPHFSCTTTSQYTIHKTSLCACIV